MRNCMMRFTLITIHLFVSLFFACYMKLAKNKLFFYVKILVFVKYTLTFQGGFVIILIDDI